MPFRRKAKELGKSVHSRLEAFLSSGAQPSVSSPNKTTSSSLLAPAGPLLDAGSETNSHTTIRIHSENPGAQISPNPPTLSLASTTGEAVSLLQQLDATSPERAQRQPAQLQASIMSNNTSVSATATPDASVSRDNWACLRGFLRVINQSAGVFGPLKAAADGLVGCIEIYEGVANDRDEFEALKAELEGLFEDLHQHFSRKIPPAVTSSMERLCKSIAKELDHVKKQQGRSRARRALGAGEVADELLACYRRIQGHLQRLSLNADLSMWELVDEQATNALLDRLRPSFSACYNSRQATELKRGPCTPGTRVGALGHMDGWVYDHVSGPVYWLNGMAGTGKTTIAYSLCKELDASHNLGASFFCSRLLPECRDVNQIVPSIAYQLAHFSRPFRWALSRVLEKERNVHMQLLVNQFEAIIVKPLVEIRGTLPEELVVVIDALDECDNKQSTEHMLEALLTRTSDLPIKFFMSSRPEPEVRDQMKQQSGHRAISRLVLHELDKDIVQSDIETYFIAALEPIRPSESDIAALVRRTGILFIYAATVVRYIGYDNFGRNPTARLKTILSISTSTLTENHTYKEIDQLYRIIVKAAVDDPELTDQEKYDMKQVLHTILCAREPLTISTLSGLSGLHDIKRVHAALRPLWSVVHVVESSELVTTLHVSFPDYMFDIKRSKSYHCDRGAQNYDLVQRCFSYIRDKQPQFNICGLDSSYMRDSQITNLGSKIKEAISSELSYACRYWAAHLECAKGLSDLTKLLEDFLSERLLLWMEVMNLMKFMGTAVGVLRRAEEWCIRQGCSEELTELTHDAWRFVAAFTSNAVSQSTPHIYVSMLPFWPDSSPIGKYYAKRMQGPMVPQGSAISRRQLEHLATWPVGETVNQLVWSPDGARIVAVAGNQVYLLDAATGAAVLGSSLLWSGSLRSIAFSPDGTLMVAGTSGKTILICDTQSRQMVLGPLEGHIEPVTSVAFSPSGTRVVSGSDDYTVRIWDASTGKAVLGPLRGHTGSVGSVAFSLDGSRVVTGSDDKSIRTWDARSGQPLLGPLDGHVESITSAVFSTDGTRIISGSGDRTIRVWNAQIGNMVLGPLEGHTDSVTSVALSLDSTRIVSGSNDKTIRVWDAQSGQMVLGPLEDYAGPVTSVAFSPEGTRIVSVSGGKTICVWDSRSGQKVLALLECHRGFILSASVSADGTWIISGSDDKTTRVWDIQTGRVVPGPFEGHIDSVTSVTYSHDSARIVSGSGDMTVRMWDAKSGELLLGPLNGHTEAVISVALSYDRVHLVSGSNDKTIRMWDARSGKLVLGPLKGHTGSVTAVAFSPGGTRIVSSSHDKTICVWDAQSGEMILGPLEGHAEWVLSVAFSPDESRIVSGSSDKTIRMWDAQTGQLVLPPLESHTGSVKSVAFSPDGTRIVTGSGDETIRLWDARTGQMVLSPLEGHTSSVTSVAFSPDGTRILSGSYDKTIRMWDAGSRPTMLSPVEGHADWIRTVAFSPDGTCIASGSDDQTLRVWDARSGQSILGPLKDHTDLITSAAFSPDGTRIVSGSFNRVITVWDSQSGQAILGPLKGHTKSITSVAFSPDGARIVSGSSDKSVRIWDARNGQVTLGPLEGHANSVTSVAFSSDSTKVVSGSWDNTVRVWDIHSGGDVLGPLEGHTELVTSVAFSPDSTRIVSGSGDKTIRVWDSRSGILVLGPLEGHTKSIISVAFSLDGSRLVSGSSDKTICIWDAQVGRMVLGPLEGHSGSVRSVAFSPDGTRVVSGSYDNSVRIWDVRTEQTEAQPFRSNIAILPSWNINEDGWVMGHDVEPRLLVWVPPDVRRFLLSPRNILSISTDLSVGLYFVHARIGEDWVEGYRPA